MSRRFRLAALERLRTARLEESARALAAARSALAEAHAARDALTTRLSAAVPPQRATPEHAVLAGAHREALRVRLANACRAVADAEQQVELAVAAWRTARAELRAVEALHERHRAVVAAADARRDRLVLDDLAAQAALRQATRGGGR
jgi:flagellar export protein FliJ